MPNASRYISRMFSGSNRTVQRNFTPVSKANTSTTSKLKNRLMSAEIVPERTMMYLGS